MKYIFYLLGAIIAVGLLIIFLAAAIEIFIFRGLKAETGTIGDTFGGLLSPVIGVISIYFIYQTFKAQGDQLSDQKKVNKATLGSIYIAEVKEWVSDIENDMGRLHYYSVLGVHTDIDVFEHFSYKINMFKSISIIGQMTNDHDWELLRDMKNILLKVNDLLTFQLQVEESLDNPSKILIERRLQKFTNLFVPNFIKVFNLVQECLRDEELKRLEAIPPISFELSQEEVKLFSVYKVYFLTMKKLENKGYVKVSNSKLKETKYIEKYGVDIRDIFHTI